MLFCNRSKDFQKETKLTTIPWSKHNITVGSKDLHVFVPDDSPNMFDTISRLKDVFCPRSAINSEYWLFDESSQAFMASSSMKSVAENLLLEFKNR